MSLASLAIRCWRARCAGDRSDPGKVCGRRALDAQSRTRGTRARWWVRAMCSAV